MKESKGQIGNTITSILQKKVIDIKFRMMADFI